METRARRAARFASTLGIRLSLAEYAVDNTWDVTKSGRWLRSVTDWAGFLAAGGPLRWACHFATDEGGDYRLPQSEHVSAYTGC